MRGMFGESSSPSFRWRYRVGVIVARAGVQQLTSTTRLLSLAGFGTLDNTRHNKIARSEPWPTEYDGSPTSTTTNSSSFDQLEAIRGPSSTLEHQWTLSSNGQQVSKEPGKDHKNIPEKKESQKPSVLQTLKLSDSTLEN